MRCLFLFCLFIVFAQTNSKVYGQEYKAIKFSYKGIISDKMYLTFILYHGSDYKGAIDSSKYEFLYLRKCKVSEHVFDLVSRYAKSHKADCKTIGIGGIVYGVDFFYNDKKTEYACLKRKKAIIYFRNLKQLLIDGAMDRDSKDVAYISKYIDIILSRITY